MIETLKNFYIMFKCIIERGMKINFDDGETLVRYYDKNKKLYLNYPEMLRIPKKIYNTVMINDEFRKSIMKLPQTEMELEYEFLNYVPIRIKECKEQDGRHYYPRVRFLADKNSLMVISYKFVDKNEYKSEMEYVMESIEFLVKYFYQLGRPKKLYVRDEESKMYLKDIADKAQIKLVVRSKLKAIDEFYATIM